MRTLILVLVLSASPAFAQRASWQQDAPINPSAWIYRVYFDVGPVLLQDVVCTGTAPQYDCLAPLPLPAGWTVAYMTAENVVGESLPSNPVYSSTPIELVKPTAPQNFRLVP